jgi:hypothetical protein
VQNAILRLEFGGFLPINCCNIVLLDSHLIFDLSAPSFVPVHIRICPSRFCLPTSWVNSRVGSVPAPSHLTPCTSTKSVLYFDSSLETVTREPALYKLLTFHNLNIKTGSTTKILYRNFILYMYPVTICRIPQKQLMISYLGINMLLIVR